MVRDSFRSGFSWLVVVSLLAVCVVWGSTYLAIRVALEGFPPFLMAALHFLLAGGVLYLVLRPRGAPAPEVDLPDGGA